MSETVVITRSTSDNFEEFYESKEDYKKYKSNWQRWKQYSRNYFSSYNLRKFLIGKFPVVKWLPKYKKVYLIGDLISAATVGVIRIPQGMAYALLAGVPPVYGLYSCFFPVILWFFFSTSKHTSVGTNAVICLMLQNIGARYSTPETVVLQNNSSYVTINDEIPNHENTPIQFWYNDSSGVEHFNSSATEELKDYFQQETDTQKLQIVLSASLVVGLMQLIMAVCRLGFLTTLMPDPVIQGFTTGASFHVALSQVKYLFGLSKHVHRHSGAFEIFYVLIDICKNVPNINIVDLVITIICVPTMLISKHLSVKYKKKLRNIPVPIELILIIISTLISYFAHLESKPFNVNIVKTIPTGFQAPAIPSYLYIFPKIFSDCLIMAFISVAVSLSLTKIYADKNEYDTDANQEIFALGVCNTFSTFIGSFAVAASLTRTAIQESAGGRTQLVSILSSSLMLIVLLWIAPFFQPVPKSVLACIIIVALKSFFLQFSLLPALWKVCPSDFFIWIVTCVAVVLIGVDYGLFIGIGFSIGVLLYRMQHPKHGLLGRIVDTDLYANKKKYPDATEITNIKIYQFSDSVSYTNKDGFRIKLYEALGCNPSKVLEKRAKYLPSDSASQSSNRSEESTSFIPSSENINETQIRKRTQKLLEGDSKKLLISHLIKNVLETRSQIGFTYLILDATMWSFVDSTGGREIVQLAARFNKLGVTMLLAGVSSSVLKVLDGCGLFEENMKKSHVFVTLHDAVVSAEKLLQESFEGGRDLYASRPGYPGFDALLL